MSDGITIDETIGTITLSMTGATITSVNEEPSISLDGDAAEIVVSESSVRIVTDTSIAATVVRDEVAHVVAVAEQGPQGVPAQGTGPSYTHTQASAAAAWVVAHNLGRKPMVDVQSSDQQVTARVTFPNDNGALVEFNSAVTGQAICF